MSVELKIKSKSVDSNVSILSSAFVIDISNVEEDCTRDEAVTINELILTFEEVKFEINILELTLNAENDTADAVA